MKATANVMIQCVAILYNIGVYSTIIPQKSEPSDNDNCVMSFVIPRDKVKTSCQLDEKVKRRINVLETKLNMYKDEVTKLQTNLRKERQLCHERIDALEGKLTTFDSGERYFALEKKLQSLEIVIKKGSDSFVPPEKVVANRQSNLAKSGHKKSNWSFNDDLESVVKPIVISEIENYLDNFTNIAEIKKRENSIENNAIMDTWLRNDQSYVEEPELSNGSRSHDMIKELEHLQTKLNQTGDELVKTLGKYLKNVTIKKVKYVQNITYLDYGSVAVNETVLNLTENSNEKVPTEPRDITVKENKASVRISIAEAGDETQRDQEHEDETPFQEVNLYTDELEEILRGEINSLLQTRMEEVVSLMRKQSATLVHAVDQQGKELDNLEEGQEEKMKRLQDTIAGLKLEVSSLSQTVQEFYMKLEKLQSSQITMEEVRKNMSTSFLPHKDQEMVTKLDEHGKKFRTFDRLYGILRQSLQHYRNESKVAYTEMQSKLSNLETSLARDVSSELYWNLTSRFAREMDHYNESTTSKLNSMEAAIRNLEDNSVLFQMDIKSLERRHKSKTGKLEEDTGNLKNRVDRLNSQNRKLQENVNTIKTKQRVIQTQSNATATTLENLQIEFKLSITDTWVEYDFEYDTSRTECFGKQYIRPTKYKNGRLVGVVLCSNLRYKIMLANTVNDKFANIGDVTGFGEDHCEFVGAKHTSLVRLSPPAISMKTEEGFARENWGQEPQKVNLNFLRPSPAWYECGLPIP